jgi:hypothetical protein
VEQVGLRKTNSLHPSLFSLSFSIFHRLLLNEFFITAEGRHRITTSVSSKGQDQGSISEQIWHLLALIVIPKNNNIVK